MSSSSRPGFNCPNTGQTFSTSPFPSLPLPPPPDLGCCFGCRDGLPGSSSYIHLRKGAESTQGTQISVKDSSAEEGTSAWRESQKEQGRPWGSLSKGWGCGRGDGAGESAEDMSGYGVSAHSAYHCPQLLLLLETCTNLCLPAASGSGTR